MAEPTVPESLIRQVVQRVLAEIQPAPGGGAAGPAASSPLPPTGRKQGGEDGAAARKVFVTAAALAERAAGGAVAALTPQEVLTPAAKDWAAAAGVAIRRSLAAPASRPGGAAGAVAAPTARTIGLVAHRPDGKVEGVIASALRAGWPLAEALEGDCPLGRTEAMCRAVVAGRLAGGIVIDRHAAAAMVVAAKVRGIRPVQGTSSSAVEAALRQFDANVLVVGHAGASAFELRSMIERFVAGRRAGRDRTALMDALDRLEQSCE